VLEVFIRQCEKHVIGNTWGLTGVCIVLTASPTGLRASFAKWVIREHQLTRVVGFLSPSLRSYDASEQSWAYIINIHGTQVKAIAVTLN